MNIFWDAFVMILTIAQATFYICQVWGRSDARENEIEGRK